MGEKDKTNDVDWQVLTIGALALSCILCFISLVVVFSITDGVVGAFAASAGFWGFCFLVGICTYPFWGSEKEKKSKQIPPPPPPPPKDAPHRPSDIPRKP